MAVSGWSSLAGREMSTLHINGYLSHGKDHVERLTGYLSDGPRRAGLRSRKCWWTILGYYSTYARGTFVLENGKLEERATILSCLRPTLSSGAERRFGGRYCRWGSCSGKYMGLSHNGCFKFRSRTCMNNIDSIIIADSPHVLKRKREGKRDRC